MSTTAPDNRLTTYNPTVATTEFEAQFPVFDSGDIAVIHNGEPRTDFTVSATYSDGVSNDAKVNFASGLTGKVLIAGQRAPRRQNRFGSGPIPTRDLNLAFDTIESEMQEARRDIDRSMKVEIGETPPDIAELAQSVDDALAAASAAIAAANGQYRFGTVADFVGASVPSIIQFVQVSGYYTRGDGGGALYGRLASAPDPVFAWHKQIADGSWWELCEPIPNILMFGARAGSAGFAVANVTAINTALRYKSAKGGGKVLGAAGAFFVASEIRNDGAKVEFDGLNRSTILKATDGFTDTQIFAIGGTGNIVSSTTLDCSALMSGTWLSGVRVEDGSTVDCGVRDCTIKDASFCGIWMHDDGGVNTHTRFFAERNFITNVAWIGISFSGVIDGRIDGNTVKTAGYVGITLQDRCVNTKITKNYVNKANPPYRFFTGPGSIGGVEGGFLIGYAPSNRNTLIDSNICEDNRNAQQDGIGLGEDGTEHGVCIISNNIVIHAGLFGIDVASQSTVIGNRIIEPAQTGIFMSLDLGGVIRNSVVANNTVLNCNGAYGMQITNSFGASVLVQDCIISGNVFSDSRATPTMQFGIRVYRQGLTINNLQIVDNEAINISGEGFINDGPGDDWPIFVQGNRWRNQMKSVSGTFSATGYEAFSVSNAPGGALRLFTGGYEGKEISVYFSDGNTTIYPDWANAGGFGANRIVGLGNASRVMAAGDMAQFRYKGGVGWQITSIVDVS